MLLGKTPFGNMPAQVLVGLSRAMELREVAAGTVLCREGEAGGLFCIVVAGLLKAYRDLASGREFTIFLLRQGDSFGFLPLLDGGPFPMSIEAIEPSRLLTLGRGSLLDLLDKTPEFSRLLLEHMAGKIRECVDRLSVVTSQSATTRVAHALLSLALPAVDGHSGEAVLPVSQKELAQTIGVAPENLSRALARLQRQGLIRKVGQRHFVIPSLKRFQGLEEPRKEKS